MIFKLSKLFFYTHLFITFLILVNCKKYDNKQIDHALINTTEELRLKGKTEDIINLNKKYINISKNKNYKRGIILGYINIANVYAMIGQYKKGILNLNKAKNLLKNENDDYLKMRLYHEYGQINYVIGLSDVALKYNSKAISHGKRINTDSIKTIFSNLYTVRADFINSKHKDSTLIYFHKGLQEDDSELNNALIGNYHSIELHNQDSAKIYLEKSLDLMQNQEYWTVKRGIIYSFYAYYLYGKVELDESLKYLKKSSEILSKTNRVNKLPLIYANIIQISQLINDKKTEQEYSQKLNIIKDNLQLSANKAIDISLSNALQESENNKYSENIKIITYTIIIITIIIFFITFLYYKNKFTIRQSNNTISTQPKLENLIKLAKKNSNELYIKFCEFNPEFINNLYLKNSELSKSDINFCIMIWLGFSSKEIAQYTFIEHRSVQNKKGKLRKKLNINSDIDIYIYIRQL